MTIQEDWGVAPVRWESTEQWTAHLKAECDRRAVDRLKAFYAKHGRAPKTSREAHVSRKATRRCGWANLLSKAFSSDTTRASHVKVNGNLFPYGAKAPYEVSGHSVRGAIEYEVATELMKCHECGVFFRELGLHSHHVHGISSAAYKVKHGLSPRTALAPDSRRKANREAALKRIAMQSPEESAAVLNRLWAANAVRVRPAKNPAPRHGAIEPSQEGIVASLRAFRERTGHLPVWNDCLRSRKNGIVHRSTIRRCFASWQHAYVASFPVDPLNRHVMTQGQVWLYEAKAPYEKSGESIRGAVEYDLNSDTMKCHECGVFFRELGLHIRQHSVSASDYKIKHGLRAGTALVGDKKRLRLSDSARARMAAEDASGKMRALAQSRRPTPEEAERGRQTRRAGLAERRNMRGGCREQCLAKLQALASTLGRTPLTDELRPNGLSQYDLAYHFGTVNHAMRLAGLLPRRPGQAVKPRQISVKDRFPEKLLIRQLRMFFCNYKRIPRVTDIKRGFFTCDYYVFICHWGSWRGVVEAAFSPREIAKDRFFAKKCSRPYPHPKLSCGPK